MAKKKGSKLLIWIAAIGVFIVVASTIGVALLLDAGGPGLEGEPEFLHVRVNSSLTDAPGAESMLVDPADLPPLTTELTALLRDAATDDDIKGLFLDIEGVGVGWAQTQELRDAIGAFQAAGKPCIAWADTYSNKEYYLATACGTVYAPPTGLTLINGLAVTQTYYAGTLEKLGVTANFEHVGDFKSAVEPYQRTGPSEAAQLAMDAMLDGLFGTLVSGIAEGRDVSEEQARAWIEDPPMTASQAVELGMMDGLAYRDEVMDDKVGGDPTSLKSYLRDRRRAWRSRGTQVAVLHIDGTIVGGRSDSDLFGGRVVGDRTVVKHLEDIRKDDDIKAVVLRVNSPGGSGSASDAMWHAIELTREKKPVVVSMADYAASGGYYVSMGASWVLAEPSTLTGSIGVFGGKMNLAGLYDKAGLTLHTSQRGRYAQLLSSVSDFDPAEREKFRSFLQGFYDIFVSKAAAGRGMSVEDLHAVAQGRVWTGAQALERGLVDELGGLDAALAKAAALSGSDASDLRILRYPERKGFLEQLMEQLTNPDADAAARVALLRDAGLNQPLDALAGLVALERVLDGQVAALLPGQLQVD